ncbi:MAG: YjbQ family protein [Candidatus Thorarchaeota archaeon]
MSEERLYQPDFSSIFGKAYSNAFLYGQVDTLVWPVFNDIEMSDSLKNLLKITNNEDREYFYHRKISLDDEKIELNCSNINFALIQALELGREYGITNSDLLAVVRKDPRIFKGVLSFNLSNSSSNTDVISNLKNIEKKIDIVGIVFYPSYTKLDLTNEKSKSFREFLNYCKKKNYFIKIDIGNLMFPENYPEFASYEKIKSFLSRNPNNIFVLSGLDISGDINLYYQLMKYFNNLWIEIDPRTFGGMTPTDCFKQIFNLKGFVQNCWYRLLIGSATPTLEISQVVRGFIEATEGLPFSQRCILRTWAFRNVNRLNSSVFMPESKVDLQDYKTVLTIDQIKTIENDNEIHFIYRIQLRSYSITQLIFLTKLINNVFNDTVNKNPTLQNGEMFIRSYHTTTSLLINEHEYGNYLDLHYKFAEISKKDSSNFLHTVRALENRADFNPYDHQLATVYGNRQLILPIINRKLDIGKRENFYALVTFGPRTFFLFIKIRFLKEK